MSRRVIFILLVLAVTLAVLFWRPFVQDEAEQLALDPNQLQPDFIAEGLFSRIYSASGELQHRIDSTRMAHYNVIGLTELTEPVYLTTITRDENQPPERWQVTAKKGSFYDDQRLILENEVRIVNLSARGIVQSVETDQLVINTERQVISTDQPVLILGPHVEVRGEGMRIDLNAQQLELTEHVKTTYYPERAAR